MKAGDMVMVIADDMPDRNTLLRIGVVVNLIESISRPSVLVAFDNNDAYRFWEEEVLVLNNDSQ